MSSARRGFHTTAPLLLESGWLPMPLPEGKKKPPPEGMTGAKAAAMRLAEDPHAWAQEVKFYLQSDNHATANTGVRLPADVLALDIDDYVNGKGVVRSGWSNLEAFAEAHGLGHPSKSLPKTIRITSRGYADISGQRFYRLPAQAVGEGVMDQMPGEVVSGVDVLRPKHRYTIEGGSLHPDGGIYRVYDERLKKGRRELLHGLSSLTPGDLPELPVEWVKAIISSRAATLTAAPGGGEGAITTEARAEAREALHEWIDEHDLDVDDLTRDQALSLLTLGGRRAVLAFSEQTCNNSNVTRACVRLLATLMEDVGAEGALPIVSTIDIARNLYVKNGSQADRPKEFDRALEWAFPIAKTRVLSGESAMTLDEAHELIEDDFWGETEVLRSCRDFARAKLVSPDALLACAITIVASWMPPHVVLPGLRGSVAGLNFNVALAAASGGGKSAAMSAAADWLNVKPHPDSDPATDEPYVTTVSTAQGLIQAYTMTQPKPKSEQTRPGELEHIQIRRSVRFEVDEIGALGAAMNAEGSMLKDFIKTMWTGSGVGTTAAEAHRVRKLEKHEYRMTIIAGVQPATADVILSGHGDGFPQRWLWVEAYDDAPLSQEQWEDAIENPPAPLGWTPPLAAHPLYIPSAGDEGKKIVNAMRFSRPSDGGFRSVGLTKSFRSKVYQAAAGGGRRIGDTDVSMEDVLDGHSVLLQEKLAALIAALHGSVDITDQFERMAEVIAARSDATRAAILQERHQESIKALEVQARRQGRSEAIASESRLEMEMERAADRVLSDLADAGGSLPLAQVRKSLPASIAGGKAEAIGMLRDMPGIVVEGDTVRLDLE